MEVLNANTHSMSFGDAFSSELSGNSVLLRYRDGDLVGRGTQYSKEAIKAGAVRGTGRSPACSRRLDGSIELVALATRAGCHRSYD